MKVFIWKRLDTLTESYHSEGGAIAVAASLEKARELFRIGKQQEPRARSDGTIYQPANDTLPTNSEVYDHDPDVVINCDANTVEMIEWFPDAGCC